MLTVWKNKARIYTIRKCENAVEGKKSMVSQSTIKLNDNVKFVFAERDRIMKQTA